MSELSLNPQLGARVKGIQQVWGFDSPAEVIATIFDSCINHWGIPHPPITEVASGAVRVKLRPRHVAYYTQMSTITGCTVSELARSTLIQWLCNTNVTPIAVLPPQNSVTVAPKAIKPTPKKAKATPKAADTTPDTAVTPPTETKPNGRNALKGLLL